MSIDLLFDDRVLYVNISELSNFPKMIAQVVDSSGGTASDCRSMGRWFEPHLW